MKIYGNIKIYLLGAASLVMLIILAVMMWQVWYGPMYVQPNQTIKVHRGTRLVALADMLERDQLITHPRLFIWCAHIAGYRYKLRYGEFKLSPNMPARELMHHIATGKDTVSYHITFLEGWTFAQMKEALAKNPNVYHWMKHKSDAEIMAELGLAGPSPEGLFFPNTYRFRWGASDLSILKLAASDMQDRLAKVWENRSADLPYHSAYEALIVASLIESETPISRERPLVASVIVNRLRKGMRLQLDPTVLYGLHKRYGAQLTKADLRARTPYNTYVIKGLPPTPIEMPSMGSLQAAVNPRKTTFLYYVATGDGGHRFSSNYQGQLQAVKSYRKKRQAKQAKAKKVATPVPDYLRRAQWLPWINYLFCINCFTR